MSWAGQYAVALLLPVLVASAASDLRHLRIPNWHILLAIGIFVATALFTLTLADLGSRLMVAGGVFAVGFILFALGLFGGGDAKMIPVIFMYIPAPDLILFSRLFAGSLFVTTVCTIMLQRLPLTVRPDWDSARQKGHVPVALAMCLAVALYAVQIANSPRAHDFREADIGGAVAAFPMANHCAGMTIVPLTCHGIFLPVATRVRAKEGTDDEATRRCGVGCATWPMNGAGLATDGALCSCAARESRRASTASIGSIAKKG